MEKGTKKKLIIAGAIIVVGGIIFYLYKKNKKDSGTADTATTDATKNPTNVVNNTSDKPTVKTNTGPPSTPKSGSRNLVSASDLLAGDGNGANGKEIFSNVKDLPYYNAKNQRVGKAPKNARFGIVFKTQPTVAGLRLWYKASNGISYYVPEQGVLINNV